MTGVIRIVRHDSAAALMAAANAFLLENEAMNNHVFGVLGDATGGRYADGENVWLSAVQGSRLVGCGFRTFPWPMSIACGSTPESAGLLARVAAEVYSDRFPLSIPGELRGSVSQALGRDLSEELGQGVYRLNEVRFPTDVPGQLRRAVEWDIDLVTAWTLAFQDEVHDGVRQTEEALEGLVRQWVRGGVVSIWTMDGEPVSMASARGPTPNGIRISLVYTPPECRGHGYASAAVAALSQEQLDRGRRFCFLFTDLGNPISNRIYKRIGYQRVGDLIRYR